MLKPHVVIFSINEVSKPTKKVHRVKKTLGSIRKMDQCDYSEQKVNLRYPKSKI